METICPQDPIPVITPGLYRLRQGPLAPAIKRSLAFRKVLQATGAAIAIGCLMLAIVEMIVDPLVILLSIIAIALLFLQGMEETDRKPRWGALDTAGYMWRLWNLKWTEEAGKYAFLAHLNLLKDPRLGSALLTSLKAEGILAAVDVTLLNLRRIPQLGPGINGELADWRERQEKPFLYDPNKGVEHSEIHALVHRYQPQMRPVERGLVQGIGRLSRIQQDIMKKTGHAPAIGREKDTGSDTGKGRLPHLRERCRRGDPTGHPNRQQTSFLQVVPGRNR